MKMHSSMCFPIFLRFLCVPFIFNTILLLKMALIDLVTSSLVRMLVRMEILLVLRLHTWPSPQAIVKYFVCTFDKIFNLSCGSEKPCKWIYLCSYTLLESFTRKKKKSFQPTSYPAAVSICYIHSSPFNWLY